MKSRWTILVDEREKRPLPFPSHLVVWDDQSPPHNPRPCTVALSTRRVRLLTGDYQLEGHESCTIIERKGHLDELHSNLFTETGRRRFIAELARLRSECSNPLILLEGDPLSLSKTRRPDTNPSLVRDALLRLLPVYHVGVVLLPSSSASARRAVGEWAAATLIAGALHGDSLPRRPDCREHGGDPGPLQAG